MNTIYIPLFSDIQGCQRQFSASASASSTESVSVFASVSTIRQALWSPSVVVVPTSYCSHAIHSMVWYSICKYTYVLWMYVCTYQTHSVARRGGVVLHHHYHSHHQNRNQHHHRLRMWVIKLKNLHPAFPLCPMRVSLAPGIPIPPRLWTTLCGLSGACVNLREFLLSN